MMNQPRKPERRRWFQFSLRRLVVVMTIVAVWLGTWPAPPVQKTLPLVHSQLAKDRPRNNLPISEGDSPTFAARKSGQSPSCFSPAPNSSTSKLNVTLNQYTIAIKEDKKPCNLKLNIQQEKPEGMAPASSASIT